MAADTPERARLIARFVALRAPPPHGFGGFATAEIAGFVQSIEAASHRLGPETWAALTGRAPIPPRPELQILSSSAR